MIQVVTTVQLLQDCLGDFLLVLNENVPRIKAEEGCLAYEAMIDVDSGLPTQSNLRRNTVTLVEAWANLGTLHAHLNAPHMVSFRETAKAYVRDISHQVLQPVKS